MLSEWCNELSVWSIPIVLMVILLIALLRGVKVYEVFVEGASEGFHTSIRIMPFLIAMMVSIGIFRDSGAMDLIISGMTSSLDFLGVPEQLVPLAIMRPLSGTGAMGLATELLNSYGPDSLYGRIASTIMGSTDTTFYILTVYFGAVGITKPRYSLYVGLIGDFTGFFASIYLCQLLFNS